MTDARHGSAQGTPGIPLIERLMSPLYWFASFAAAGGIVLLAATVVAMVWANSPWSATYHHLWETPLRLEIGSWFVRLNLHQLINDGLMVVLFFLVGLEIKREFLAGELKTAQRATLPIVAALGGMLVPAALYAMINAGKPSFGGWGIPMATDIAFALGVLALLGDRVPTGLKVYLTALAIIDDIGAVMVIALFYSTGLVWSAIGGAAGLLALAALANRVGVRRPWAYGMIGLALWMTVLVSGIHATVAGVLLALTIPVRTRLREGAFIKAAEHALERFRAAADETAADPDVTALSNHAHHEAIEELEILAEQAQPPLIRLERGLRSIVAFGIMPLFALANAGVSLSAEAAKATFGSAVTLGVLAGLIVGKPIGITLFSWLAVRLGIASLPTGVSWPMIAGIGLLGGIGFTMSLFISGLAFTDAAMIDGAKLGILIASTIAAILGVFMLRRCLPSASADAAASTTEVQGVHP